MYMDFELVDFDFFDYRNLKLFYFIGRLNPTHMGHVAALRSMITAANEARSIPLILLGSGPKGERTLDNPVPFETKKRFLQYKLASFGELRYVIIEMKNPSIDLKEWYNAVIKKKPENVTPYSVEFIRFAGDKGDNATKLKFLDNMVSNLNPLS